MHIFYFMWTWIIVAATTSVVALHLTTPQLGQIDRLIRNPRLTTLHRRTINRILYRSYEKWAVKSATRFRYKHRNKCRNIRKQDLILSSKIGLYKSIERYNGKYAFIPFSTLYVKGELYKTLTDHYSMSSVPRKERVMDKGNYTLAQMADYNTRLETPLLGYAQSWLFHDIYRSDSENPLDTINSREVFEKAWIKVGQMDDFTRRAMQYKYDFEFNRIRTNAEVAELLACSEETARQSVLKGVLRLKLDFPKPVD